MNDLIDLMRAGTNYVGEKIYSAYPTLSFKIYNFCLQLTNEIKRDDLKAWWTTGHPFVWAGGVILYKLSEFKGKVTGKKSKNVESKI